MTGTPSILADCDAHGIRLALAEGGGLAIDAPQDALTPDLLARLKAHKDELLAHLTTTIRCPFCRSHDLADHPKGLRCEQCGRLAWHWTGRAIVRADHLGYGEGTMWDNRATRRPHEQEGRSGAGARETIARRTTIDR